MIRVVIVVALLASLHSHLFAQDTGKDAKSGKDELSRPRTGRPGELTSEEEDRLDGIVDRFIEYDTGRNRDPKALRDFLALGPEAIPALLRGFNKSARMSHSCPVVMIGKKIKQLLQRSEDTEVLVFIRENAGAGAGRTPYEHLIRDLKVSAMLRQRQVEDENLRAGRQQQQNSTGGKGPGSSK
jgi:hypothetical protein